MSQDGITSIIAEELYKCFLKGDTNFLIVDLRREDYLNGHIKGSWNFPVTGQMIETDLDDLMKRLKEYRDLNEITILNVIFHFSSSKNRGPRVAKQFAIYSTQEKETNNFQSMVLVNGYTGWTNECNKNNDTSLITL